MEVLGTNLHILILKIQGVLPLEEMKAVLEEVVALAGMRTGGIKAQAWTYPLDDSGTGGVGNTIVQPLVESFLVSDDWVDLGHTFIVFASCRRYSTRVIIEYLKKKVGPIIKKRRVTV